MRILSSLIIILLTILAIGFFTTTSNADPINVGDVIRLYDGPGTTGGGEFKVYKNEVYLFDTFCVERNEYFYYGQDLKVDGISDSAIYGGVGSDGDPLDPKTAYLYTQFRAGTLSGYTGDDTSANALQIAIWFIEGEWSTPLSGLALDFYNLAVTANWQDIGNVRVLNLLRFENGQWVRAQDQLVMVPEPSTLLLMGAGLIGIGAFGRRKLKRKERN